MPEQNQLPITVYITSSEAASLYHCSKDYISRLCREGKLKGNLVGRNWFIERESFEELLSKKDGAKSEALEKLALVRKQEYLAAQSKRASELAVQQKPIASPYVPSAPSESVTLLFQKVATLVLALVFVFGSYASLRSTYPREAALAAASLARESYAALVGGTASLKDFSQLTQASYLAATFQSLTASRSDFFGRQPDTTGSLFARAYANATRSLSLAFGFFTQPSASDELQLAVLPKSTSETPRIAAPAPQIVVVTTKAPTPAAPRTTITPAAPQPTTIVRVAAADVTREYVDTQLQILKNSLSSDIFKFTSTQYPSAPGISQSTANLAISSRIDALHHATIESSIFKNGTITGSTFSGGSITDSSISATELSVSGASTFAGGINLSAGTLTLPYFSATSTSTASYVTYRFGVGTTSPYRELSVAGSGVFGGDLLAGTLTATTSVTSPNLVLSSVGRNMILAIDASGNVLATSTPSADSFFATSTTATSTFAGGLVAGNGIFNVLQGGLVGIGTTSPTSQLSVQGNSYVSGTAFFGGAITSTSTFNVTGLSTFAGLLSTASSTIGDGSQIGGLTIYGGATTTGNAYFAGGLGVGIATSAPGVLQTASNAYIGGNLFVAGNSTTLGNSSSNTLTINSSIHSNIVPDQNITYDLGSASYYWRNVYVGNIIANNISAASTTIAGTASQTFTINSDNATSDTEDMDLVFFRGNVVPNALLSWKTGTKRFEFNQSTFIQNASSDNLTGITLDLKGQAGQTGDLFRISSSTGTNLLNITSAGLIGLGSSTPTTNFSIQGNAYTSGTAFFGGAITATSTLAVSGATTLSSTLGVTGLSTLAGFISTASSTIGDGNQNGGLTINGGATTTGNFVLSGLGARIMGDYSNATIANRVAFQTNVTNGNTNFSFLPNGTSPTSAINAYNNSDPTNASFGNFGITATNVLIAANRRGTGTYLPIYFQTGSSQTTQLAIDTAGNVGVGTTTPWGLLSVNANGLASSSPQFVVGSSTRTNFIVDNAGNVGIGTSTPLVPLTVSGMNADATAYFDSYYNGSGSGGSSIMLRSARGTNVAPTALLANDQIGFIGARGYDGSSFVTGSRVAIGMYASENWNATSNGTFMTFLTTPSTSLTKTERLRIDQNGNVGIGTTTPTNTLAVHGTSYVSGTSFFGGAITATSTLTLTGAGAFNGGFTAFASSTIGAGTQATGLTIFGGATTTGNAYFAGNVGVGTTTPQTTLVVNGGGVLQASNNQGSAYFASIGSSAGTVLGSYIGGYGAIQGASGYGNAASYLLVNPNGGSLGFGAATGLGSPTGISFASGVGIGSGYWQTLAPTNGLIVQGNVGIGTSTPNHLLTLTNTGANEQLLLEDSSAAANQHYFTLQSSRGTFSINSATDAQATTTRFLINSSGNIGIGTTTPINNRILTVNGISQFNANSSLGAIQLTNSANTSNYAAMGIEGTASQMMNGSTVGDFSLYTFGTGINLSANAGTTGVQFTLRSGGNVGVGTTSPYANLSVATLPGATGSQTTLFAIASSTASATTTLFSVDNTGLATIIGGANGADFIRLNRPTGPRVWGIGLGSANFNINDEGATGGSSTTFLTVANTTGNLGVGSTTPYAKLSVTGAGSTTGVNFQTTNSSNSPLFTILDSGNVGIGTTTPGTKLEVVGTSVSSGNQDNFILSGSSAGTGFYQSMAFRQATGANNNIGARITSGNPGSYRGYLAFETSSASSPGATTAEAMRIDYNGNVGVGTTSPSKTFSVQGNSYISGTSFFGGAITATSTLTVSGVTTLSGGFTAYASSTIGDGTQAGGLTIFGGATTTQNLVVQGTGTSTFAGALTAGNGGFKVMNSLATNSFTVTNAGEVGLGTASPSAKLYMSGTYTTSNVAAVRFVPTLASSATGSQYGLLVDGSFNPSGASLAGVYGIHSGPNISGSGNNITSFMGSSASLSTGVSYTGTVVNGYTIRAIDPSMSGTNPAITNYSAFYADSTSNGNGTTTGTVTNYSFRAPAHTAAAGSGGTVNNYGMYIIPSTGSGAGTTNNYGIRISGDGGVAAAGTSNWSLYVDSQAPAYFESTIAVGDLNKIYPSQLWIATSSTATTNSQIGLRGARAAIVSGNMLGGIDFYSDDTNLTAPGTRTAAIQAVANTTHTASALGTDLIFSGTTGTTYAELMRITGAGNVGIGTTTPTYKLDVANAGDSVIRAGTLDNTGAYVSALQLGTGNTVGISSNVASLGVIGGETKLRFMVASNAGASVANFNTNTKMVIDNNGLVGIGTTSPWRTLSVNGNSDLGVNALAGSFTATTTLGLATSTIAHALWVGGGTYSSSYTPLFAVGTTSVPLFMVDTSNGGGIVVTTGGNAANGGYLQRNYSTLNRYGLNLYYNAADSLGEVMSFQKSRPSADLSAGDDIGQIDFYGTTSGGSALTAARILAEADTGWGGTGDAPGRLSFWTTPDGSATAAERMRIDSTGNVGIGTTTPASTFAVAGNTYTSGFFNTSGSTGGYKMDGNSVLYASSTTFSTFVGQSAGGTWYNATSTAGLRTTAMGYFAAATTPISGAALDITAFGYRALASNTGDGNSAFGGSALAGNTTGVENVAFGSGALSNNTTGSYNIAIGGRYALDNNRTGSRNIAIGRTSLDLSTTGTDNVAVGMDTSRQNASATSTVAIGYGSGYGAAIYNAQGYTMVGYRTGFSITTGADYNTILGFQGGYNISTGQKNILVGANVTATNSNITTGSNNLVIGNDISVADGTASNQINIANILFGTNNSTTGSRYATGQLGVGSTSPFARFSIHANNGDTNTTLFAIASSTASATTTLLSVLNTGNVGIGTSSPASALAVSGGVTIGANYNTAAPTNGLAVEGTTLFGTSGNTTGGKVIIALGTPNTQTAPTSISAANNYLQIGGNEYGNNSYRTIGFGYNSGGRVFPAYIGYQEINQSADTYGDLIFGTRNTGTANTVPAERLRITGGGNVGVGTTSPWAKFSINNSTNDTAGQPLFAIASSTATATTTLLSVLNSGYVGVGLANPVVSLDVQGTSNQLRIGTGVSNSYFIIDAQPNVYTLKEGTAATEAIAFNKTSHFINFATNSVEAMRLTSGGSLGLGTTSPYAQLSVATPNGATGSVTTLFAIASSTATATTTLLSMDNAGHLTVNSDSNYAGFFGNTAGVNEFKVIAEGTGNTYFDTRKDLILRPGNIGTSGNLVVSSGLVGIGTTSPWAKLSVEGTSSLGNQAIAGYFTATSTTASTFPYASTTALTVSGSSYFPGSGIWNSSGNVGIGTTSPENTLTVNSGSSNTVATFYRASALSSVIEHRNTIGSMFAGISPAGNFGIGANGNLNTAYLTVASSTGNVGIGSTTPYAKLSVTGAGSTTGVNFQTTNSSNSPLFTILDSGSVGIGSTTPAATLGVAGSIYSTLAVTAGGGKIVLGTDSNGQIEIKGTTAGVSSPYLDFGDSQTKDYDFRIQETSASARLSIGASTTPTALNILASGNIGIGTTTPTNTLGVHGTSYVSGASFFGGAITATSTLDVTGTINTGFALGGYKMGGTTILTASTTSLSTHVGLFAGDAENPGTALYNTTLGYGAMTNATSSKGNVAVGYYSLRDLNDADTAVGTFARNTAIGYASLITNTTGYFNTGIGGNALGSNTTGAYNSAVGNWALFSNTTASFNTAQGYEAFYNNTTGTKNSGFGSLAGFSTDTGTDNTAMGYEALYIASSSAAIRNTAIGSVAGLYASTTGSTFLGYSAGAGGSSSYLTGAYNTLVGYQSGTSLTTGANNILIGAANISASYAQVTTGSQNISIGYNVAVPDATASGQLNIGNFVYGTGLTGTGSTVSSGKIGIGTTSPWRTLSVNGSSDLGINALAGSFTATSTTATSTFAGGLTVGTNGLTVYPSGVVGIGATSTPSYNLSVMGSASFGNSVSTGRRLDIDSSGAISSYYGDNSNRTVWTAYNQGITGANQGNNIVFSMSSTTANALAGARIRANTESTYLTDSAVGLMFETGINGSVNEALRITSARNVGIASSTPWGRLAVTGAGVSTGYTFVTADNNSAPTFVIQDNGKVGIGTTTPIALLDVGTFNTSNSNIRTGSLEIQPYALNNMFIGENVYYDGSKFAYRRTGAAGLLAFAGTEGGFRWSTSGSAGANAGMAQYQLKTASDGAFAVGPSVSGSVGNFSGATFSVSAAGTAYLSGSLGIGTTTPGSSLSVAGNAYTSGFYNTSASTGGYKIDGSTLLYATSTRGNTFVGINAGGSNSATNLSVTDETAVGYNALFSDLGGATSRNVALGSSAGYIGSSTAFNLNTFVGTFTGQYASTSGSTFLGYAAGQGASGAYTTGGYNTLLGYATGGGITTGSSNVVIGSRFSGQTGEITTGSGNVSISAYGMLASPTANYQLNIQNILYGTNNSGSNKTYSTGQIGIGSTSPYARFSIQANNGDTNTTLFAIGSSTPTATTTLFVVNNVGNVGIGTTSPSQALSVNGTIYTNTGILFPDGSLQTAAAASASVGTAGQLAYYATAGSTVSATSTLFLSTTQNVGVGSTTPWAKLSVDTSGLAAGIPSFAIGSSTRTDFVINQAGNVGMGTSTPTDGVLTLVDSSTASRNDAAVFNIHQRSSTPYMFAMFNDASSKVTPMFQGLGWNSSGSGTQTGILSGDMEIGNAGNNKLIFYTNGYQSPRMSITGTGLVGIGTTSPTESLLTVATPMGATGSVLNLFRIASSTASATTTLFNVNNQGDVAIVTSSGSTANVSGFNVNGGGTLFQAYSSGVTISRTGTSNSGQLFVQGSANAASAGTYSGLVISTGISSTAGAGTYSALKINPTLTVAQASGTGLNYLISSFDGTTASTSRGFYQMAGVGAFANNIGIGSTTPFAKLSVHAQNGDLNPWLFAIASSTASATSTLFMVDNTGKVGIGTSTPLSTLTVSGSACFSQGAGAASVLCGTAAGNIYYTTANTGNYDVAENYLTLDAAAVPGTIVAATAPLSNGSTTTPAVVTATSSASLLGVVSSAPGVLLGGADATVASSTGAFIRAIALVGRVPVKVNFENGDIHTGDRIALSSTPGIGRKANAFEASVGVALEDHTAAMNAGDSVMTFMNVQPQIDMHLAAEYLGVAGATTTPAAAAAETVTSDTPAGKAAFTEFMTSVSSGIQGALSTMSTAVVKTFDTAIFASTGMFNNVYAKLVRADKVQTEELCVGSTCVTEAQLQALLAGAGASQGGGTGGGSGGATSTPDTVGPVIELQGANPATISVGASYVDLGAVVTDNVDQNLGYRVSLDGATSTEPSALSIDTSVAGTHTIVFSAEDQAGNVGMATRTVIVE